MNDRDEPRIPLLRDRLDHELAHLEVTPQARHRLLAATTARPRRRRPRFATPGSGWGKPLLAAAVAAAVVTLPVLTIRLLHEDPPVPPVGTMPPAAAATSPTSPPSSGGTPRARIDLAPGSDVLPAGSPLPLVVTWIVDGGSHVAVTSTTTPPTAAATASVASPTTAPATTPQAATPTTTPETTPTTTPETTPAPAGPTIGRMAVIVVDWGDGQQSSQQLECVRGPSPTDAQLSFQHVYRAAGRYRITASAPTSSCGFAVDDATTNVAIRGR